MNTLRYSLLAVAGLSLFIGGCSVTRAADGKDAKPAAKAPEMPPPGNAPQPGKMAPNFTLKDADGKIVHLADYKGKVVLLDFWATWCPPCKIEIPWFKEFETKYQSKGFEVIGVSLDDDGWTSLKPYMADTKFNYKILLGDEKVNKSYGGNDSLPTSFVIDRKGKIAATHVGLASKSDFSDAIEGLLKQ